MVGQLPSSRDGTLREELRDRCRVVAGEESEQAAFVLPVSAAEFGQYREHGGVQRVAGSEQLWICEFEELRCPHRAASSAAHALMRLTSPTVVSEHAGDELAGLARGVDEDNVFEAALNLGPLALLGGVRCRRIVAECKMLHRDEHNRCTTLSVGGLGKELE